MKLNRRWRESNASNIVVIKLKACGDNLETEEEIRQAEKLNKPIPLKKLNNYSVKMQEFRNVLESPGEPYGLNISFGLVEH